MDAFISQQLNESCLLKQDMLQDPILHNNIRGACQLCLDAYQDQKKILLFGNGGSAADAQHFAAELVSRFFFDRPALAAIALTTDTSILTAISNDYGYEHLLTRQLQALGKPGDILIVLSTSGRSQNILQGCHQAEKMGVTTIAMTGQKQNELSSICDLCIHIPSTSTPRIQEGHTLICHIICATIERQLFMPPTNEVPHTALNTSAVLHEYE